MDSTLREELRPLALYEQLYAQQQRAFALPETRDLPTWESWRAGFRARLAERLGGLPDDRTPPPFQADAPTQHDGYTRTYLEFTSAPGSTVPAWLLVPDDAPRDAPAVVAAHGHGYGVNGTVGLGPDGAPRSPHDFHQGFAVELCRRGLVVLAPEYRGFGRRRELADQHAGDPNSNSCHSASWWGIMLGQPLLGSRVWDTLRALDLLRSLPQIDAERVGIMGGSGGGAVTLFAAALEPAFRAAVICCYFCTFRDSILAMQHCHCNYVPGLLQDGEIYDVAALIAPRPLLIESGRQDPIFPLPGVSDAYEHLRHAYERQGIVDRLVLDLFDGGHTINGAHAYDFLRANL